MHNSFCSFVEQSCLILYIGYVDEQCTGNLTVTIFLPAQYNTYVPTKVLVVRGPAAWMQRTGYRQNGGCSRPSEFPPQLTHGWQTLPDMSRYVLFSKNDKWCESWIVLRKRLTIIETMRTSNALLIDKSRHNQTDGDVVLLKSNSKHTPSSATHHLNGVSFWETGEIFNPIIRFMICHCLQTNLQN